MRDFQQKDMDIAKNIRMIEWLKAELLDSVSGLYRGFLKGSETVLLDSISNIVVFAYVLARRCGIQFHELDRSVLSKVEKSIELGHQAEEWYGDLSGLRDHIKRKK
ncbi:MazG-like family protein [Tumebacillus sp. DT12]|uniref:MazG-like family protein n=1 Tax=Tumebacillus lacus TaxID=2995335 RepID=A0ABT3X4I6_9BACL|nr:MazG-like family protein [Tumebacillus lacus]MCX7571813.1 MazG-like family protein [Tumebacillus lacus]